MSGDRKGRKALALAVGLAAVLTLAGVMAPKLWTAARGSFRAGVVPVQANPAGGFPEGVTEDFALQVWGEQAASYRSLGSLADGRVVSASIDSVEQGSGRASANLTVRFKDGSSGQGVVVFGQRGGKWYFQQLVGKGSDSSGGDASVLGTRGNTTPQLASPDQVDMGLLKAMLNEMADNQKILSGIIDGTFKSIEVVDTSSTNDGAAVDIRLTDGQTPVAGRILMTRVQREGQDLWFVTSFQEKQ